jgi:hypothetical protein
MIFCPTVISLFKKKCASYFLRLAGQLQIRDRKPKASPSSKVCGRLTPNVSGNKTEHRAPAVANKPMISKGNSRE